MFSLLSLVTEALRGGFAPFVNGSSLTAISTSLLTRSVKGTKMSNTLLETLISQEQARQNGAGVLGVPTLNQGKRETSGVTVGMVTITKRGEYLYPEMPQDIAFLEPDEKRHPRKAVNAESSAFDLGIAVRWIRHDLNQAVRKVMEANSLEELLVSESNIEQLIEPKQAKFLMAAYGFNPTFRYSRKAVASEQVEDLADLADSLF